MIKIIKKGNKNHNKFTCPFCGCEFTYDESDIEEKIDFSTLTYPQRTIEVLTCPWCHYSTVRGTKYKDNLKLLIQKF